jgi:hypothetical protein
MADLPSQSISINDSSKENLTMVIPEEDEDVRRLSANISMCIDSILFTKRLIQDYVDFFERQDDLLGDDGNEITKKHFSQGLKCLESYQSIMTLIEQLVKNMDFPVIASKLAHTYNLSTQYEKKFYFLENKVKMVSEFV